MKSEFNELESKYFDLTEDKISVEEFEKWVYQSKWLESELNKDEYLNLISVDFTTPSAKYEVGKILENKINEGKFEKLRLLNLLDSIIERDGKEGEALVKTYDLYCDGYYFLMDLGLGIGLQIVAPTGFGANYYHELNDNQKKQLLNSVYPVARELAEELKTWIINEELIITGELDLTINRWQFIDKRTEKDRQSRVWRAVDKDEETNENRAKQNLLINENGEFYNESKLKKKWWKKLI